MQTNIIAPIHNEKKETTVQVVQIIELGNASELTLGAEKGWFEYGRPSHNPHRIGR